MKTVEFQITEINHSRKKSVVLCRPLIDHTQQCSNVGKMDNPGAEGQDENNYRKKDLINYKNKSINKHNAS